MKLYSCNQPETSLNAAFSRVPTGTYPWDFPSFSLFYPSAYASGIPENDTTFCEIITPGGLDNPLKLLIFLHGFSANDHKMDHYHYFIHHMVRKGYTCAFLHLPYHLHRTPQNAKSGQSLIYFDDVQTLYFFHQSVVDIRRLIDIMEGKNLKEIHICGLSMGSMVSVLAMAHEPRIEKGVLLIGGGHWQELHWNGILRFVLKGNCVKGGQIDRNQCKRYYAQFPDFLIQLKKLQPDFVDLNHLGPLDQYVAKKCFLCDPLAFAHRIDSCKVLMLNATFDFYFSRQSTRRLWEELGKPEILWPANFHSGKIITDSHVLQKINHFLNA